MRQTALKILWIAAIPGFLFMTSCKRRQASGNPSGEAPALLVDAYIAQPLSSAQPLLTTANLLPYEEVELKAPVSGTVMGIFFTEGQQVREGQSLVQLDDRIWKAQISGLKARLLSAESELRRNEALLKVEGVSQEAVDQSRAAAEELKAKIEELSVYVGLANIKAPFSGQLGMRNFSVGTYLTQGQTITRIAQNHKLKVEFDIPSLYVQHIREGMTVQVVTHGDTSLAGIYAIDPVVSTTSRTLKVRAMITSNQHGLVPGDFSEVHLQPVLQSDILAVPTDAIVPELGAQTVFVVSAGKAVKRNVELGSRTPALAEILSGIRAGDTVITTGILQIRPDMPVRVRQIINIQQP